MLPDLQCSLELSIHNKKGLATSGSVALSASGNTYAAGTVATGTHLLDIPSELAALVRAVHDNDVMITEVRTLVSDPSVSPSPIVLKILADHSARTGAAIHYTMRDAAGGTLFDTSDVREVLPFYRSDTVLNSMTSRTPGTAIVSLDQASGASTEMQLRYWALAGRERNFPTRDGASGYGAAILTASGKIYYGGQYSDPHKRTGVHAEMAVLINALMDGARDITHIGIASSKFVDTPCSPCGCCRQFIAEMCQEFGFSPAILLFASANETFLTHTIEELLPVQWSNKK